MDENALLQMIEQAAREQWTDLDLANKGLTVLPPQIGQVTSLRELHLSRNKLTTLPAEIGHLTSLRDLGLGSNRLTTLPAEIGRLKNLEELYLDWNRLVSLPREIGNLTSLVKLELHVNQLTALPAEIGHLKSLNKLGLGSNQLTTLPSEIGRLTSLRELYLDNNPLTVLPSAVLQLKGLTRLDIAKNGLTELPAEIKQLSKLTMLGLRGNRLTELPTEIGALANLTDLYLDGNQLTRLPPGMGRLTQLRVLYVYDNPGLLSPPSEIVEQGTQAVLSYLRAQLQESGRQWVSKLILVGEGGVGKTATLRSLRGEEFDPQLPTTHGIGIHPLEFKHPTEADVTMHLNCWDFGGQQIYHATHQFFLTNRSLFLLVWATRQGFGPGHLYYWLDAIQARAPESPVLLVAARIDERDPKLPLSELRSKYPQIIGQCDISNKPPQRGIDALRGAIAHAAASLPLMGEVWPATWLNAAEAIRAREEKYLTPGALWKIMADHEVPGNDAMVLARWLHELGEILYFPDDEELSDMVIFKPQWVSEYISKVLESEEVIRRSGIFTRAPMDGLWRDLEPAMRNHFLRLMERFDLSYRTPENQEISLVVERLPHDAPDYAPQWNAIKEIPTCREISMKFRLNTIPPGIPTWFIARSHRFTTHTHWRTGALFADGKERRHLALAHAFPHERYLQLTVRGPQPHNFFTLLRDGLEITLQRFPGLQIERLIPCPGHKGEPCPQGFKYEQLLTRLERKPPKFLIECPESQEDVDVRLLLFGLDSSTLDQVLIEVQQSAEESAERHKELLTLLQREFANDFRREQSKIESHCPNVFVLHLQTTSDWKKVLIGESLELQLYCQAPGCWHPTNPKDGGRYVIDQPARWLRALEPYVRRMVSMLKFISPIAGAWTTWAAPAYAALIKNDISLMQELVKALPTITETRDPGLPIEETHDPERVGGAALRALRLLLDEKDPTQHWGGLMKVLTPEGHYLWLCKYHAVEYAR
jgi:internalin A